MNQLIQTLADKAEDHADSIVDAGGEFHPAYTHKLAELIVRQMLAITDAHIEVFQTDRDRALIEHIKQSVKTHFGVEQ